MKRESKRISIQRGELFAEVDGRRIKMCDCKAAVQIEDHFAETPILKKGRIIDGRSVVLLITFEHINAACINDGLSGFCFRGEVLKRDGALRVLDFSRCDLLDDLDLTSAGTCRFEVTCSQRTLDELNELVS